MRDVLTREITLQKKDIITLDQQILSVNGIEIIRLTLQQMMGLSRQYHNRIPTGDGGVVLIQTCPESRLQVQERLSAPVNYGEY